MFARDWTAVGWTPYRKLLFDRGTWPVIRDEAERSIEIIEAIAAAKRLRPVMVKDGSETFWNRIDEMLDGGWKPESKWSCVWCGITAVVLFKKDTDAAIFRLTYG